MPNVNFNAPAANSVNFMSPQALIAPDLAVQQEQLQRQQALADALRQQALTPSDAPAGWRGVSDGIAKLGQALIANRQQKSIYAKQTDLSRQYAGALRGMFGGQQGGGGPSSPTGGADPPAAPPSVAQSPAMPASQIPPQPMAQIDPNDAAGASQGAPQQPQQPPMQAPVAPPQAAQPSQRGPWSLSGNPQQDMGDYLLNQEEYGKAVIGSHAPVDIAKLIQQSGIDPNGSLGRQLMQAHLAKENFIAPTNARGGSYTTDNMTGKTTYNPNLPEGSQPLYNENGQITAVRTIDGVVKSVGDLAGAKAGAEAGARAQYDPQKVYNPTTGAYEYQSSATVTGHGASGGASGGGLNGFYGKGPQGGGAPQSGPFQAAPGPGAASSQEQGGKNSANAFQSAIDAGSSAKNAMRQIDQILGAAKGLPTGTGAATISGIKSAYNAVNDGVLGGVLPHADPGQIAKFDEMAKGAATLGEQLSQGGGGTDARLKNAIASLPGAHYSPAAIQEVGANLKALQAGALAKAQAAARAAQNGMNDYPAFERQWQQAFNPDVFYHMQKGVPDFQKWVGGMSSADRQRTLGQYRAMKGMGGF